MENISCHKAFDYMIGFLWKNTGLSQAWWTWTRHPVGTSVTLAVGSSWVGSNNWAIVKKTLQSGRITMTNPFSSPEIIPRKKWLDLKMYYKYTNLKLQWTERALANLYWTHQQILLYRSAYSQTNITYNHLYYICIW